MVSGVEQQNINFEKKAGYLRKNSLTGDYLDYVFCVKTDR